MTRSFVRCLAPATVSWGSVASPFMHSRQSSLTDSHMCLAEGLTHHKIPHIGIIFCFIFEKWNLFQVSSSDNQSGWQPWSLHQQSVLCSFATTKLFLAQITCTWNAMQMHHVCQLWTRHWLTLLQLDLIAKQFHRWGQWHLMCFVSHKVFLGNRLFWGLTAHSSIFVFDINWLFCNQHQRAQTVQLAGAWHGNPSLSLGTDTTLRNIFWWHYDGIGFHKTIEDLILLFCLTVTWRHSSRYRCAVSYTLFASPLAFCAKLFRNKSADTGAVVSNCLGFKWVCRELGRKGRRHIGLEHKSCYWTSRWSRRRHGRWMQSHDTDTVADSRLFHWCSSWTCSHHTGWTSLWIWLFNAVIVDAATAAAAAAFSASFSFLFRFSFFATFTGASFLSPFSNTESSFTGSSLKIERTQYMYSPLEKWARVFASVEKHHWSHLNASQFRLEFFQ